MFCVFSQMPNPESQICNPKSQICNPKSAIPNLKSAISNPKSSYAGSARRPLVGYATRPGLEPGMEVPKTSVLPITPPGKADVTLGRQGAYGLRRPFIRCRGRGFVRKPEFAAATSQTRSRPFLPKQPGHSVRTTQRPITSSAVYGMLAALSIPINEYFGVTTEPLRHGDRAITARLDPLSRLYAHFRALFQHFQPTWASSFAT